MKLFRQLICGFAKKLLVTSFKVLLMSKREDANISLIVTLFSFLFALTKVQLEIAAFC